MSDLAKPTPLLAPLESLRIRVDMTWPKCFNMVSSSCSSIDRGRLEMYKLVGSCSCCCRVNESEKETEEMTLHNRKRSKHKWKHQNICESHSDTLSQHVMSKKGGGAVEVGLLGLRQKVMEGECQQ